MPPVTCRRAHPRFIAVEGAKLTYRGVDKPSACSRAAVLVDVSQGGMLIRVEAPEPPHARLWVDVRPAGVADAVTFQAEVMWVREDEEGGSLLGLKVTPDMADAVLKLRRGGPNLDDQTDVSEHKNHPDAVARVVSRDEHSTAAVQLDVPVCSGMAAGTPVAVIDVGAKAFRLFIVDGSTYVDRFAEHPSRNASVILDESLPTELAHHVLANGTLSDRGIQHLAEAAQGARAKCNHHGVQGITAVGTSVFRAARNVEAMRQRMQDAGVPLEVLSGTIEGTIGVVGMIRSVRLELSDEEPIVSADIGGGSTEVCVSTLSGNRVIILERGSYPCGSSMVLNALSQVRDLNPETMTDAIHRYVQESLGNKPLPNAQAARMVCMGGCVGKLLGVNLKKGHGRYLHRASLEDGGRTLPAIPLPPGVGLRSLLWEDHPGKPSCHAEMVQDSILRRFASEILLHLMSRYAVDHVLYCGLGLRHSVAYVLSTGMSLNDLAMQAGEPTCDKVQA